MKPRIFACEYTPSGQWFYAIRYNNGIAMWPLQANRGNGFKEALDFLKQNPEHYPVRNTAIPLY